MHYIGGIFNDKHIRINVPASEVGCILISVSSNINCAFNVSVIKMSVKCLI